MIPNFHDYQVWLASTGGPTGDNEDIFTNAWISVNLDDEPGLFGHQFTQVGITAYNDGLHWFVYAEPGVICYYGDQTYGNLGCRGDVNEFVEYGAYHKVELVTYGGENFWTARVTDRQGNTYTVARILSTSKNVYDIDVNMEEGWNTLTDPYEFGIFHMWHPQYNNWVDGFDDWPLSDANISYLYAMPSFICPEHYGAKVNLFNDPYNWSAGTDRSICTTLMFPVDSDYLPGIIIN